MYYTNSGLWNIIIVEEDHLRKMVNPSFANFNSKEMLCFGFPTRIIQFMNLVIVKNSEKGIFTVVKNRWTTVEEMEGKKEFPLSEFDEWFRKLQDIVREIDARFGEAILQRNQERSEPI
jgi:hypothetical protein